MKLANGWLQPKTDSSNPSMIVIQRQKTGFALFKSRLKRARGKPDRFPCTSINPAASGCTDSSQTPGQHQQEIHS